MFFSFYGAIIVCIDDNDEFREYLVCSFSHQVFVFFCGVDSSRACGIRERGGTCFDVSVQQDIELSCLCGGIRYAVVLLCGAFDWCLLVVPLEGGIDGVAVVHEEEVVPFAIYLYFAGNGAVFGMECVVGDDTIASSNLRDDGLSVPSVGQLVLANGGVFGGGGDVRAIFAVSNNYLKVVCKCFFRG